MSADRAAVLQNVAKALAPLGERAPLPDWDDALVVTRKARGATDLWMLFAEQLRKVNGVPMTSPAELAALLAKNNWTHGYCDPGLWPQLQGALPKSLTVETAFDRRRTDDYEFGITVARGVIAETGTVILTDRGTPSRLAALAPWVHVAVIQKGRIFRDVPAAVGAIGDDPNIIWCTGPSKTADVEGILIEGVHGPGQQWVLCL